MDNNGFDWMAVQMQVPDKSFNDLTAMGVDPSTTTLQSADFYRNTPKIQNTYKQADGSFDNDKFNQDYLKVAKSFNEFKQSDFSLGNVTTDLYSDDSITRALGLPIRRTPVQVSLASKDPFTALKNAQNSFYGLTEINKWSKPQKSIAEVAEGQSVVDGVTGKKLDYTPEDTGLYNLYGFLSEPLVLAQYDQDVKDDNGKTIHKKGDYKFNDQGLPFYETLSGRNPAGKQILSRWDTLTKEDSYWNKFDFMDSDDLNKSVTGSLVKAAVQYAPMLIPGVNTAYAAYTISSGLLEGGASIVKALDGIINGPDAKNDSLYKWANELQGYVGQQKGSVSQHAKENWWDMENLLNTAVDSVYILKSQNGIAAWPTELKKYQIAKELGLEANSALNVGEDATKGVYDIDKYIEKYGPDLTQAVAKMQGNIDKLNAYATYAGHISNAYMAATTAASIMDVANQAGIDARDQGFLYLGYTAALIPFFNSQFGHWVNQSIGGLDEFSGALNKTLKDKGAEWIPDVDQALLKQVQPTNEKGKALFNLARGKELANKVISAFKGINFNSWGGAMVANAVDMTTQKAINDGLQVVYNGLASAGFKSTQQDAKFDANPITMAKDLLTEGVSGAFGGAMFHLAHLATGTTDHAFKSDKLYEYSLEGYGQEVQDMIDKMEKKGQFGDTTLSAIPLKDENGNDMKGFYAPVSKDNPISQNAFIADRLRKTMKVYDALKDSFGFLNPNVNAEAKNQYYQAIIDTKTDTDLPMRHRNLMKQIMESALDIQNTEALTKESDDTLIEKKAKLNLLKKDLEYLQGDASIDEFFVQGLFNIRSDINTRFGVKNRETIAKEETGKGYKELTLAQQKKVDDIYQQYVADEGPTGLMGDLQRARKEYQHFSDIMEHKGYYKAIEEYRQSTEHLRKYVMAIPDPYIPEGEHEPVALGTTYALTRDYMEKMAGVKYIPDYIFDHVKTMINHVASGESDEVLKSLSVNAEQAKQKINSALKGDLDNDIIKDYVKKLVGDKTFDDITDSEAYKDVRDHNVPDNNYSTLRLIKTLSQLHDTANLGALAEQRQVINQLEGLGGADLDDRLYMYSNDEVDKNDPLLANYNKIHGLFDYIDYLKSLGLDDEAWSHVFTSEGLNRFVLLNDIEKKLGKEFTPEERDDLYNRLGFDNIYMNLLVDGHYNIGNEHINTHTINNLDDSSIHQSMDIVHNFDIERKKSVSPLTEILKDQYAFLKDQQENIDTVGAANYLNADPAFMSTFDSNLKALERVAGIINATATINPIINDFRANHKGMLDDASKDIVLTILDDNDMNTLYAEVGRMHSQVKYLRDVNEYNVNNQLAKLLREDGYELVSKVSVLKDIATDERVAQLLPSLQQLYNSPEIDQYTDGYKSATTEQKASALAALANIEENVYRDVKKLAQADVIDLVNRTFKPINVDSSDFYSEINPDKSMEDSHRTLYLATLYGTSVKDFYSRYVGTYDKDSEGFTNLLKSPHIPFVKQENAVRIANLMINGSRDIVQRLLNAFSYADTDKDTIDFTEPAYSSFQSTHIMAVLGSAGSGKTTAVLSNIMNMVDDEPGNTLLLAPKERQVGGLQNSLAKSGFTERIDERSSTVRKFIEGLNLKKKDGTIYNPSENDNAKDYDNGSSNESLRDSFNKYMKGVFDNLDLYQHGKLRSEIANIFDKTRLIAIDEFTHVSPFDIALLTHLVNEYNSTPIVSKNPSKNITIITLGDENQMGYTDPETGRRRDYATMTDMVVSQPLTTSLRSGWDLVNNTLIDINRRTINIKHLAAENPQALRHSETLQESKENPIKLFHYTGPDGTVGIRSVRVEGEVKASDLDFITTNKNAVIKGRDGVEKQVAGKDFVYVVNKVEDVPKAQALLREAFGNDWQERANIEVYTPEEVQGGEYKYAIIDAVPRYATSDKNLYDIVRAHEFLNTMLSRATEATLFIDRGAVDGFVKLENVDKDRAINQVKITDDVITNVKDEKQKLVAAILGPDYVPEGAKPGTVSDKVKRKEIPLVPIKKPIFEEIPEEVQASNAKVSNITAYTTFSTKSDFDKIRKLPTVETGISDSKIENIINSLKYYIVHGREIGENNVALAPNFQAYLSDYDYDSPRFFIELSKRNDETSFQGRSELNPAKERPIESFLLKVQLPSNTSGEPLELTLGSLNTLKNLSDKYRGAKVLDDADRKVNAFVEQLKNFIADPNKKIDWGTTNNGIWRSKTFTLREWRDLSTLWSSRIFYDNTASIELSKLRQLYPDFHISEPQVVVASLKGDDGKNILDPSGTNPEYKDYWKKLQSKSIAFISEYKELQSLSPDQLLDIYMKQIQYFNTPEFKTASYEDKQAMIDKIQDRISVNRGQFSLPYKPNMVKMIRLDNPRDTFLGFRERYLTAIAGFEKGTPIQQLFEAFDMTPYVKDRLVKSLLTLRQFLSDGKDNRDFFEREILVKQHEDADARIAQIREQALERYGESPDFDQNFERHDNFDTVVLGNYGRIETANDFLDKLNDLLDLNKENNIYLRAYDTIDKTGSAVRQDKLIQRDVTSDDLTLSLSSDKRVDFSKSIVDLNLLNLFKQTKSLNFAELIDASLTALSKLPEGEKRYDKYRLNDVFKDGKIESIVIATRSGLKGNKADNILADVKYAFADFKFGFKSLQQAAYNIDFNKVLDSMSTAEKQPVSEEQLQKLKDEVIGRVGDLYADLLPSEWLDANFDIEDKTDENLDDAYERYSKMKDRLDSLNETVRVPKGNNDLTVDDLVALQLSPNGVVAQHTVGSDVKHELIEHYSDFKQANHDNINLNIVADDTTPDKAVFIAEHEGNEYKVIYYAKDRSIEASFLPKEETYEFGENEAKRILEEAADNVGKKYLATNPNSIRRIDDFKKAFGEELHSIMSDEQKDAVMHYGWRDHEGYFDDDEPTKEYSHQLADRFLDRVLEKGGKDKFYEKMLKVANDAADQVGAEASAVGEEAQDVLSPLEQMQYKGTKGKVDPMEKLGKDIRDENEKSKREFEYKARDLFKGAQAEDPLKSLVKNFELSHRRAVLEKKIQDSGLNTTLADLKVSEDISAIDPIKLSDATMMELQKYPDLYKQYKKAFQELLRFRIERTQQNC